MARAKRTDRTEARRRYREEQAALGSPDDGAAVAADRTNDAAPSTAKLAPRRPAAPQQPVQQRPSIMSALRGAVRPLDVVGDIKALPRLLLHWSFWGPALLTLASTVLFLVWAQGWSADAEAGLMGTVAVLALQMFVFPVPAPVGSAFLAGFGSPRASWLLGIIVGIIASACYAVVLAVAPADLTRTLGLIRSAEEVQGAALAAMLAAPIGSALFAAAAAWYKRFLNLANPNRAQGRQQPLRPQKGRGDIRRDRLSH